MQNVIAGEQLKAGEMMFIGEDGKAYGIKHLLPPGPPALHWDISKKQVHDLIHGFVPHRLATGLADSAYRLTTLSEFLRFWEWSLIWTMRRKKNFRDCDAATRKLKGMLVCEGWAGLVPLDIWYKHANGGRHSEFATVLVDESLIPGPPVSFRDPTPYDVMKIAKVYLCEPSKRDMIRPCLEYFAPETGRSVYRVNQ